MKKIFIFIISFLLFSACKNETSKISKISESNSNIVPFPFSNANLKTYPVNEENIPLLNYNGKNELYPITYTQAAKYLYHNYYITKNESIKSQFLNIADFIKKQMVYIDDFDVLQYNFHVKDYNYKLPATSSMSQGFALGVMAQAYSLTGDQSYIEVAEKILNSYGKTIDEGGILNYWDELPIYEEYVDPKSHVLNGFIFSLSGLYYYYKTMGSEKAKKYFDEGVETLVKKLPEYDATFTSYYSKTINSDNVNVFASAINNDPDHFTNL